jgi:hypothetical protein
MSESTYECLWVIWNYSFNKIPCNYLYWLYRTRSRKIISETETINWSRCKCSIFNNDGKSGKSIKLNKF